MYRALAMHEVRGGALCQVGWWRVLFTKEENEETVEQRITCPRTHSYGVRGLELSQRHSRVTYAAMFALGWPVNAKCWGWAL